MVELIHVTKYNAEVLSYARSKVVLYSTAKGLKKTGWVHIGRIDGKIINASYYKNKQLALDSIAIMERIPF